MNKASPRKPKYPRGLSLYKKEGTYRIESLPKHPEETSRVICIGNTMVSRGIWDKYLE